MAVCAHGSRAAPTGMQASRQRRISAQERLYKIAQNIGQP
ncbi:MAG: hypothetical protein ACI9W4_002368, partial [Rhodothermales bacterium]